MLLELNKTVVSRAVHQKSEDLHMEDAHAHAHMRMPIRESSQEIFKGDLWMAARRRFLLSLLLSSFMRPWASQTFEVFRCLSSARVTLCALLRGVVRTSAECP